MSEENDESKIISTPYDPTTNFLSQPSTLARFVEGMRNRKYTASEVEEKLRKAELRFWGGIDVPLTSEQTASKDKT
jgi:hypothetical protein